MNRVLYSGKMFDETELKRVNTILQNQATAVWASVRTYSFLYQKGRKRYFEGYSIGSESMSDYSETNSLINQTLYDLTQKQVQGAASAAQAAEQAQSDKQAESASNTEEETKSNMTEIVEGLPDDPTSTSQNEGLADLDAIGQYAVNEANKAAQEAAEDAKNTAVAQGVAEQLYTDVQSAIAVGGDTTYYDSDGNAHEYSNNGSTTSVTNATVETADGTVTGTLHTGPGGSWVVDSDGNTHVVTTTTANDYATGQTQAVLEEATQDAQEAAAAYDAAQQKASDTEQQAIDTWNEAAKAQYEENRDPDDGNGGYSESDSSNWHSDDYDPSEWGGF